MSADPADVPPAVVDPRVMRDVLGHFVSGVTVVTATAADGPVGFTCQSFSSLSLDPPLVAFAPARTSTTWPRLRAAGGFCVNVLAEEQSDLSRQFARSGTDKYAGVSWAPSPHGSPMLEGVVAWIDSELWAEYDGGDHTIVVARVLDLGADPSRTPLLFHRGAYGLQQKDHPAPQEGPPPPHPSQARGEPPDGAIQARGGPLQGGRVEAEG